MFEHIFIEAQCLNNPSVLSDELALLQCVLISSCKGSVVVEAELDPSSLRTLQVYVQKWYFCTCPLYTDHDAQCLAAERPFEWSAVLAVAMGRGFPHGTSVVGCCAEPTLHTLGVRIDEHYVALVVGITPQIHEVNWA